MKASFLEEISFWNEAMKQRKLLNTPWIIDPMILEPYFLTQENSNNKSSPLKIHTPRKHKKGENFTYIEQLQDENLRDELEITSPYFSSDPSFNFGFTNPPSIEEETTEFELIEASQSRIENKQIGNKLVFSETRVPPINVCNQAKFRSLLLQNLMILSTQSISLVELYQLPDFRSCIEAITIQQFQQQSLSDLKTVEEIKAGIFYDYLERLTKMGLITISTHGNLIDLKSLKQLSRYCQRRLSTLIRLQSLCINVDYNFIRQKLKISNLTKLAIISIYKETIKVFIKASPSLLKSWWIDLKNDTIALIHLEYS